MSDKNTSSLQLLVVYPETGRYCVEMIELRNKLFNGAIGDIPIILSTNEFISSLIFCDREYESYDHPDWIEFINTSRSLRLNIDEDHDFLKGAVKMTISHDDIVSLKFIEEACVFVASFNKARS